MARIRIGIIGFGFIGRHIYEQLVAHPELGMDVAFVWNRSPERLAEVPRDLVLEDLDSSTGPDPDLVVEMAHPGISASHGELFLQHCNYLMLSVTAMADAMLNRRLIEVARQQGTSLFIPHGALVGLDHLYDGRYDWSEVTITFRKPPASLDFSQVAIERDEIVSETLVFEGSVGEAARRFPRNVNTMATCALASLGFERTQARLIADPGLEHMSAEVVAIAADGSRLETRKLERAAGVSGQGMLASQWQSLQRAALGGRPGMNFV